MTDNAMHRNPLSFRMLLFAAALVLLTAGQASAASWGFSVSEAACAAGPRVLLGEIAQPFGNVGPAEWQRLAATELWESPAREGQAESVSRGRLQEYLAKHLGDTARRASLPTSITVQRGGALVTRTDMAARVVGILTPAFSGQGEVELRELNLPAEMFLPRRPHTLEVQLPDRIEPGRINFRIRALAGDGRLIRQVAGSVFADLWVTVPCAVRPINTSDTLAPEMVTFKRKNLAFLRGSPWDGRGGPWRVKRPVGNGQPLLTDNLEPVPLVEKGDMVTMVYRGTSLTLSMEGEVVTEGGFGERIMVRNLQSGREVQATVVDAKTVAVR